jgi:hypothetical protein
VVQIIHPVYCVYIWASGEQRESGEGNPPQQEDGPAYSLISYATFIKSFLSCSVPLSPQLVKQTQISDSQPGWAEFRRRKGQKRP